MELKTKRLILRKPKLSDWKDVIEGIGDYDDAKMMVSVPYPYGRKYAEWFIKLKLKEWKKEKPDAYLFFIELKSEKKVIGAIEVFKINRFFETGETGSWVNKKYWRNGYMTEAKIALNDFAFNKVKLRRLDSPVFKDNVASNATQVKMGYVLEGTMRKAHRSKATGKIHDINIYGLLKEDWKKKRQKLIKNIK
jgi:ribosomal-protein-alanine N-acetyltransferase